MEIYLYIATGPLPREGGVLIRPNPLQGSPGISGTGLFSCGQYLSCLRMDSWPKRAPYRGSSGPSPSVSFRWSRTGARASSQRPPVAAGGRLSARKSRQTPSRGAACAGCDRAAAVAVLRSPWRTAHARPDPYGPTRGAPEPRPGTAAVGKHSASRGPATPAPRPPPRPSPRLRLAARTAVKGSSRKPHRTRGPGHPAPASSRTPPTVSGACPRALPRGRRIELGGP